MHQCIPKMDFIPMKHCTPELVKHQYLFISSIYIVNNKMSLFYSYETLYSGNLKWELTTVESISMQYPEDKEWEIKRLELIPKQYCYPKDWKTISENAKQKLESLRSIPMQHWEDWRNTQQLEITPMQDWSPKLKKEKS